MSVTDAWIYVDVTFIIAMCHPSKLDCNMNDLERQIEEQRAKWEAEKAEKAEKAKLKPSGPGWGPNIRVSRRPSRTLRKLMELEDLREAQKKAKADYNRNLIIGAVVVIILLYLLA